MRRIAYIFLGLALVGAATWYCSSDAPSPTPPRTVSPGPNGTSALQIRLFTSNANPVAGTCTLLQAVVTLNGANVPDGTGVAFTTDLSTSFFQQNGLPLVSVVTQGGTTTTALCSTVAGLATVRATSTIGSETGTATIQIAFQPSPQVAPFFTFCNPSFGPPEGGTALVVNGGRFFGDSTTTRATFTAAGITREALVTGVTATTVSLVTPAFPEASSPSVPVSITLTFGTKSATPVTLSLPNCFSFGTATPATPTITAVLPSSGSNDGNTRVTIIGSGFVTPLQVFFGPVEAQVLSVSFNQIIAVTPPASGAGLPNLNASVTVRVHEVTSGLDAILANGFRFVTKAQITAAEPTLERVDRPFTPVTIHGQGFLAPVSVSLAGIPATVISVSATELLVLPGTPFLSACTDVTGPIVMNNINSGDSATGPTFTYQVAITKPVITAVSPAVGPPGATVTISGSNLGDITNVTFGTRPASIVSVSNGSIVVTVPDNGATAPACPAGTPAGTPLNVGNPVDVTVTSSLTTCTTTAAASFQYQLPCKPGADLSIAKTASPSPVVTGSNLTYTLSVNNNGPNTATAVVVSDPLPGGTTFLSCSASQGSCSLQGNSVVANLGDIPSPGFASVTIVVNVNAPGDSTITNTAVVSSATPDTNTANNTVSVTTNVSPLPPTPTFAIPPSPAPTGTPTPGPTPTPLPSADLSLTKDASPNPVVSGSTLTYLLGVTNNGPNTSFGVVVTDPLPVGTTFVSCSTSQGNCLGPAVGSNGTVSANLGSLASPGFAQVTIVVTVTAPGGQTLSNTAVVNSSTADPVANNNIANKSVTVSPAPAGADLSVVKTSSASTVPSGGILAYTVMVHNGGPDPATGVIMTDAIPTGTTFVSCTPSQGTCTGPAVGTNGTVTANLGTMPLGSTVGVTIVVNVTASSGSILVNTAVVSSAVTDPNPANNSSTNVTSVGPPATPGMADLSISKTGSPNPVLSGSNLTYSLQVSNLGPSPSDAVVVSDTLPPGTTFISCGTSQGVCTFAAGTVTANLGTVGSSGSATVTIVVHVTAPGGTTLTNAGSVCASTPDPNPCLTGNNVSTITTTVNP